MKLTRHHPKGFEAISDLVQRAAGESKSVVFQAGHFLLVYDQSEESIYPCIYGESQAQGGAYFSENYGHFPVMTWRIALRLMQNLKAPSKHIMIVVNDWQYIPKSAGRFDFYKTYGGRLPAVYQEELTKYPERIRVLEPKPIKNGTSTAPFFGEMNLRNRYQRRVEKLIASGDLPASAVLERTPTHTSCSFPSLSGELQEIYCSGKTGDCSGEIAEMLRDAAERTGATTFVNLYPAVCRDFVELGTSHSVALFRANLDKVLNLGFPSSGVNSENQLLENCEASLHEF